VYFVQYVYEIVGDYSVAEELGTVILEKVSNNMEEIICEVSCKTNRSVLSIKEIQFINN
jgi:hypothetical protein